ncbi:MAG: M20 family metallo-hydrolase [Clostridia bacterium]|jgi:N-carbamoyl-L-amino-acid hydrolase|nr:M20 family metallo-hydrolase [Clostridia bacterium]
MQVNRQRLEKDFNNIAQFGSLEKGGVTRLAFTPEDMKVREYLKEVMEELGLTISIDAFGNMRGRRDGRENLPPVIIGSHLDTVPEGGHFDGVVGVIGALEVIRVLNENNIITKRPVEVINFSCEESSRFGGATLGSKAMAGKIGIDDLKKYKDKAGISLYEELESKGFRPNDIASAQIGTGDIYAFVELHIEQGPVLEANNIPIGIVTSIAAPTRFKVIIEGRADHSGNTPMGLRKDALAAASELVLGVEKIAREEAGENTVGTVGYLYVQPGAMNVVPGKVELGIDIRDINSEDKLKAVDAVKRLMGEIAATRGVKVDYEILTHDEPVSLAEKVINTIEVTAQEKDIPYIKMPSGAGHDAMHMADIAQAGMIFIPSINGISHNIAENSKMEDIVQGTELLLAVTIKLAQEGEMIK